MRYLHVPPDDHRDLASGKVLHSRPGQPAFPVRLARELFGRARHHLGSPDPVAVWDPCCGSAQLLVTLGLSERRHVRRLVGSDIDDEALALAARNARLVSEQGLADRAGELRAVSETRRSPSHEEAAAAAGRLADVLRAGGGDLPVEIRKADALDPVGAGEVAALARPDVVIADLPHGRMTSWRGDVDEHEATTRLATTLAEVLAPETVLVLVSRSRRPLLPRGTRALDRLRVGHRSAGITRAGWVGS